MRLQAQPEGDGAPRRTSSSSLSSRTSFAFGSSFTTALFLIFFAWSA
jgi:hypothetical protein